MKLVQNHQINIYSNVDFLPNDNIVFDDIEKHLSLFTRTSAVDIGPNKSVDELDISFTLKINVSADSIRPAAYYLQQYNYCRINKLDKGTDYNYYFITDCNLLSEGTLELTLQLDTLNTFSSFIGNSDYWSRRTITTHQHKDRFDTDYNVKIDMFDEGLGTLPMCKESDTTLKQDDSNVKWYLVYESESDDADSPINVKVYASEKNTCKISANKAIAFTKSSINSGVYYWDTRFQADGYLHTLVINNKITKGVKWLLADLDNKKIYYGLSNSTYNRNKQVYRCSWDNPVVVDYDETKVTYLGQYWAYSDAGKPTQVFGWPYALKIDNNFFWQYRTSNNVNRLYIEGDGMKSKLDNGYFDAEWTVATIDDVDRTNKLINKIVECPYCPLAFNDGVISEITINFEDDELSLVSSHYGPLYIPTSTLKAFASKVIDVKTIDRIDLPSNRTQSDVKDIKYETKLLNSNFSKVKFTYDSFTKEFKRELFNESTGQLGISYYQSLNLSSKLLFSFSGNYNEYDDYDKYLSCSRNNESTLYNSDYLNYIRNGYNYDLKNKALMDRKNTLSIVSSAVGVGVSNAIKGGLGTFNSVQSGIGLLNNVFNLTTNQTQQELAIEQKKTDALNTTVGVSGADDASLLNIYNGNKLHMFKYSIRDELKNSLFNQFYLTGYSCNDYGVPNLTSRQNFNYIQATTTIDTAIPTTTSIKNDIVNRISQGIMIVHKCQDSLLGLFSYENWETILS